MRGPNHWVRILLTGLAFAVLLGGFIQGNRHPAATGPGNQDLLQLAGSTHARFEHLLQEMEPEVGPHQSVPAEEQLMQCQAAMLEMKELETELRETGVEILLADDLGKWLVNPGLSLESGGVVPFLRQILNWIRDFTAPQSGGHLERLMILPDPGGGFPALSIELSGSASWMGARLLALEGGRQGWKLAEVDLRAVRESGPWWLRGTMSYSTVVPD